jgi:small-conductance mechanosensitive channel
MPAWSDPLTLALCAAILFIAVLRVQPLSLPFLRAALRIGAFSVFTLALLHAGISPNRPVQTNIPLVQHSLGQFLIGIWWLGGASVATSVLRASIRIRRLPIRERLIQDIFATATYIIAALQISSKVFGWPIGALLATSGAVAIVVGLALQSTLGDAFSGLVLNLTRPYKIGDWIAVGGTLEGKVVETNWRATYILTVERNLAVIPNSVIAKTHFINASAPSATRGVTVSIQLRPDIRPQTVKLALLRAALGHAAVLSEPAPRVTIKASTVNFVEYEVRFFVNRQDDEASVTTQYFDIAFQHLDAFSVSREPPGVTYAERGRSSVNERMLERTGLFDALPDQERDALMDSCQIRGVNADDTLHDAGHRLDGLLIVISGVLSISMQDSEENRQVARLNPGDYWFDPEQVSPDSANTLVRATTPAQVLLIPRQQAIALTKNLGRSYEIKVPGSKSAYGDRSDDAPRSTYTETGKPHMLKRFVQEIFDRYR